MLEPKNQDLRLLPISLSGNHDIDTPLRYPGGKSVLSGFVGDIACRCGYEGGTYVEPYSGGAGVALRLLNSGVVSKVVINDLSPDVYAFWDSAVNHSEGFLSLLDEAEISVDEWRRQKEILRGSASGLLRGFAFFYLNRTCRSGVITGGVIGGLDQSGRYKVGARFNKASLRAKLEAIAARKDQIEVTNLDGVDVVAKYAEEKRAFLYVDPPYVEKAKSLYMDSFGKGDHARLASVLRERGEGNWLLTYDQAPLVASLYAGFVAGRFGLAYSANGRRAAEELMMASNPVMKCIEAYVEEHGDDAV